MCLERHWPDHTTHFVLQRTLPTRSPWIIHPPKNGKDLPVAGIGAEAVVFKINASHVTQGGRYPMILKSYAIATSGDGTILDNDCHPSLKEVERKVNKQMTGYQLLFETNQVLKSRGEQCFALPPTVRKTISAENEPSILMTDLTKRGKVALIEVKHLLLPKYSIAHLSKLMNAVGLPFSQDDRRQLANIAIQMIENDIQRGIQHGLIFGYDMNKKQTTYPHQFSAWSILIDESRNIQPMIHDFSGIRKMKEFSQVGFMYEALEHAKEIWK